MIPSPSPAHGPAACPACPSQGPLSFLFNLRVTSLSSQAMALEDGPAPALLLIYSSSRGPLFPEFRACLPSPKAKNTKYLLSPQHLCPPLLAVASVYREISYWPCHPLSPPPLSPRYSRATTCLSFIQWYRPGLKSPRSQWWYLPSSKFWDQSLPKGVPRPLRLVLEGLVPLHLAYAGTLTPQGPVLPPGLNALSFPHPQPRPGMA